MAARLACVSLLCLLAATLGAQVLAPKKEDKQYALLVGVKKYDHAKLADLKYTENDAVEMSRVLKDAGFDEIVLLTSTEGAKDAKRLPTRANIQRALKDMLDKAKKADTVLVGLAGHGVQYEVKGDKGKLRDESFFCPTDAKLADTDDYDKLSATMVSFSRLFKDMGDSGAGTKLLLVDACRNEVKESRSVNIDAMPRPGRGVAALFSCKGGEMAFESKKLEHGVFFYHVIDALKGKAQNRKGEVTWTWLADHVIEKVSEDVPILVGGGARQTPHLIVNIEGRSPLLRQLPPAKEVNLAPGTKNEVADRLYREGREGYFERGDYQLALRRFRQAEDQGDILARGFLGLMTRGGLGVAPNEAEGTRLVNSALPDVEKLAEKGNPDAICFMAAVYGGGLDGAPPNEAKAMTHILRAAEKGHGYSMWLVGRRHRDGRAGKKDQTEAMKWIEKAAGLGIAAAMSDLGWMYYSGEVGGKPNYPEALRWYQKSAALGNAIAIHHFGEMYFWGRGVKQNDRAAVEWYRKAAEKDYAKAMFHLGNMYLWNRGVTGKPAENRAEAIRWYKRAAALGYQDASKRLQELQNPPKPTKDKKKK